MSIPKDWKLVPVEPTTEMKTAGIAVEVYPDSPPEIDCLTWEEVRAIYQDMLSAAPTPPEQQDDEALEVLQTIVSAYDKFKLARGYSDDRNEWILAARALIAKRGAA